MAHHPRSSPFDAEFTIYSLGTVLHLTVKKAESETGNMFDPNSAVKTHVFLLRFSMEFQGKHGSSSAIFTV